jgi:hypothetical protein
MKVFLDKLRKYFLRDLPARQEVSLMLLGGLHSHRVRALPEKVELPQAEFKVFSQFGEDGILQYLISKVEIPDPVFIEFGVQNYCESNTRFLLLQDNWRGLVIDGAEENIQYIKNDAIYWRHQLTAMRGFITKENINGLIASAISQKDIGLLSIDIDGNDYWVWKAIDVVHPRIVVCEYNSLFGNKHAVSIPYEENFFRTKAHFSNLYFGASLPALCHLAESKGYDFVGSNSAGNNAFFVRKDLSGPFKKLTPQTGFVEARFRESRDPSGGLSFLDRRGAANLISELKVTNVLSEENMLIRELQQG